MCFLIFSKSCSPEAILPLWPQGRWPNVHHRKKEVLTIGKQFLDMRGSKRKPFWSGRQRAQRERYIVRCQRLCVYPSPPLGSNVKMGEDEREKLHLSIKSLQQKVLVFSSDLVLGKTACPRHFTGEGES